MSRQTQMHKHCPRFKTVFMISQSISSRIKRAPALNIVTFLQQVGSLKITVSETIYNSWREITLTAHSEIRSCLVSVVSKLEHKPSEM